MCHKKEILLVGRLPKREFEPRASDRALSSRTALSSSEHLIQRHHLLGGDGTARRPSSQERGNRRASTVRSRAGAEPLTTKPEPRAARNGGGAVPKETDTTEERKRDHRLDRGPGLAGRLVAPLARSHARRAVPFPALYRRTRASAGAPPSA